MTEDHKENQPRKEVAHGIRQSRWTVSTKATLADTDRLYKKRTKVFPKRVKGPFRRLKWFLLFLFLGIYYFIPFLRWDRGPGEPNQAVLVDFANARFYFFGIEIWPQEVYYITGLLILAALGLFLASALFGRLWCGFACPQTIWTDLYIAVERFFEGDRNARIKLEKSPWNTKKILKKTGKHITWLIIAMLTGGAWILYFHDAFDVIHHFFTGQAPMTAYVFVGILTFTTYMLAGFMREQVCTYMCPWPRIQAAMTDEDALNVTYRYDRGEPRGPHKKGEPWEGRGDCIDCRQCIAVCPTGIDIRDGLQLECIGCSLCIDACNGIMDKIGRPRGLIGYDTDKNIQLRLKGEKPVIRLIRPRTIVYALLFTLVGSIMLWGLTHRTVLSMNVLRDRIPNYVVLKDGSVRNGYKINILNKKDEARDLKLSVLGLPNDTLSVVGVKKKDGAYILHAEPDQTLDYKVYVAIPDVSKLDRKIDFSFRLTDIKTGEHAETPTVFVTGNGE